MAQKSVGGYENEHWNTLWNLHYLLNLQKPIKGRSDVSNYKQRVKLTQDTASSLKPKISINTTERFRLTVFHIHLNFDNAYRTNIFFQIFEENCSLGNCIYEIKWSPAHSWKDNITIMRLNWLTGQKAGFDDSKLRRDLVRVYTGEEFL